MITVHKDENIHKNAYGQRRWSLPNSIDNSDYVPEEASPQIQIEGIIIAYLNNTFFEEVRKSYTQEKICRISFQLLSEESKDKFLIHSLDEI
ncbi:hypothetical protein O181_096668 [Austropuccinia psidii MF-1]|uniref:Uncharacterized protein n=1 Tax=Austropuccinia psidii MF-1 TaxID=1389203 RepID=A0A9Q3PCE5_9BASI|nr:hypothetical protein [Austropuccinia psidii MF-1]